MPENPELQPNEIPINDPGVDGQLICDLLLCQDVDEQCHLACPTDLAWKLELNVDMTLNPSRGHHAQIEDAIMLATASKKQRNEIKQVNRMNSEKPKRRRYSTG